MCILFSLFVRSCENQHTCTITADDATFANLYTVDPCPDTRKYLEVIYLCESGEF